AAAGAEAGAADAPRGGARARAPARLSPATERTRRQRCRRRRRRRRQAPPPAPAAAARGSSPRDRRSRGTCEHGGPSMRLGTALDGITVVELAQVFAVPHTGQLLAADGARVLKVEPPTGDLARRQGALLPGGTSTIFETFNRGKELATADLHDPAERERVAALATAADVFITNQDVEYLRSVGLDYASLSAA